MKEAADLTPAPENRRMAIYQALKRTIGRYLDSLSVEDANTSKDATDAGGLPEFPKKTPKKLEELREYIDGSVLKWLEAYDEKVLGGYDDSQAIVCHDPDLCIPCFVGVPTDQPLYIQYLYCAPSPGDMDTMSYEEILEGVKLLQGVDKEKFIYELRLGFLESASNGKVHSDNLEQLIKDGPEKFYDFVLTYYDRYPREKDPEKTDDELRAESKREFDSLVARAKKNRKGTNPESEDFVYEKQKERQMAHGRYHAAFNQLRLVRDLIINEEVKRGDTHS